MANGGLEVMQFTFNLVDDPWIRTVDGDGRLRLRSLREAFRDAADCDLVLADPLEFVALVRQVLLPVVIDALGYPRTREEWAERLAADAFDGARIEAYLEEHRRRFDLFDPVAPFGQVAGLTTTSAENPPAQVLLPAVPTGNNVPLFGTVTDAEPVALSPAEAARAMLVTQCWDTAGIKTGTVGDPATKAGKTYGNQTGSAGGLGVLIPWSTTLHQGLTLNLGVVPGGVRHDDAPPWRRPPATPAWSVRVPTGRIDLLTWPSRRIRLLPGEGEGEPTVTRAIVAAGDRIAAYPQDLEPHTMWRRDKNETAWRPLRHRPGRALWQGLRGLLALRAAEEPSGAAVQTSNLVQEIADLIADDRFPDGLRLDVIAVGVEYGNQSAVIENVITDRLPLPVGALADDPTFRELLLGMADTAAKLHRAVDELATGLALAAGYQPARAGQGRSAGGSAPPSVSGAQIIGRLDPLVRQALEVLRGDPDHASEVWASWRSAARQVALEVGESLLRSAPPGSFWRRPPPDATPGTEPLTAAAAECRFRQRVNTFTGWQAPAGEEEGA